MFAWEKMTIFSEKFAQERSDPRHFSSWGCWHQLCALEGPPCLAAEQTSPPPPPPSPRKQGKQGSAPASLCWGSLHGRCRGQVPSEPAGRLPHASPASEAQLPGVRSLWLHGPWCSFWHKQPLNPVLGMLLPTFS